MEIEVIGFKIEKKNVDGAFKALSKIDAAKGSETLQIALQRLGWHGRVNSNGDVIKLQCVKYNAPVVEKIAEALAPFVPDGAQINVDDGTDITTVPFKAKPSGTGKGRGRPKKDDPEEPANDDAGESDGE